MLSPDPAYTYIRSLIPLLVNEDDTKGERIHVHCTGKTYEAG